MTSATNYLNELNTSLLTRLQEGGAVYLSNAVIDGVFAMRACIVNFRTTAADVDAFRTSWLGRAGSSMRG